MSARPRVFIVGGDQLISRMFLMQGWAVTGNLANADLVQFTGGDDVTPNLYGELTHPTTRFSAVRDQAEINVFHQVQEKGLPSVGICRGGQFLHVMSGGKMFQHVSNHGHTHVAWTTPHMGIGREEAVLVTSTHHQMMRMQPRGKMSYFTVLLYAKGLADTKQFMDVDGNVVDSPDEEDIESVFHKNTNSLSFQPHPEYMEPKEACPLLYFELIEKCFGLKV